MAWYAIFLIINGRYKIVSKFKDYFPYNYKPHCISLYHSQC